MINGQNFIGIGTTLELRKLQKKHGILIACDENTAQYIQIDDELYHADWMRTTTITNIISNTATVVEITKDEYDEFAQIISDNEEVIIDEPVDNGSDIDISPEDGALEDNSLSDDMAGAKKVTVSQKIVELTNQVDMLEECILELSKVVYE